MYVPRKYAGCAGLYGGTLTGPIYVEGAQTGDMIEVQILPGLNFCIPMTGGATPIVPQKGDVLIVIRGLN
jgi:hypothetical protein